MSEARSTATSTSTEVKPVTHLQPPSFPRWKPVLVAALTLAMAGLVLAHVYGVNGPWYARWPWRRLAWFPLFPAMLAAATPFCVAQYVYLKRRRVGLALFLLAIATLALQLAPIPFQLHPPGVNRMTAIVFHTINTSYYTDAVILHEQENIATWEWLYQYPDLVPLLHLHAKYKPPGLVLYFLLLIKIFGKGYLAATIGGIGIALLAASAVPATYWMLSFFGRDRDAAFCGASYFALIPSLILFLPQFDQVYPAIGCVLLVLWGKALTQNRIADSIGFGSLLALALFLSYIFLILGVFLATYTIFFMGDHGRRGIARALSHSFIAIATCAGWYLLLWALTGFDPIATFRVIGYEQTKDLPSLMRPFPRHIFFDVLDLALGTGWISFLLTVFILATLGRAIFYRQPGSRLILLALLQIITTALAALLPGETARLWLITMPLLMAPVGFELAEWPGRFRILTYSCLLLLTILLCQNMTFIYMGLEVDGPR